MTVLSAQDKARLLLEATRGPEDVYALRSVDVFRDPPAYWRPVHAQVTPEVAMMHLAGDIEIGSYALLPAGIGQHSNCWWIVADFDGKKCGRCHYPNSEVTITCESCGVRMPDWKADVTRFLSFFLDSGANLLVNRSRSGAGAHVRVLFREPVPAWMARRWMMAWLDEASVVPSDDDDIPKSFDRCLPFQDRLSLERTSEGRRSPGSLVGSPLNKSQAVKNGGTLPISPEAAAMGNFDPDGRHWDHVVRAVEQRSWGIVELTQALADAPGTNDLTPPPIVNRGKSLSVLGSSRAEVELLVSRRCCEFMRYIDEGGEQSYALWIALASQLHRFGEVGRAAFHEMSALDPRYRPKATEKTWETTAYLSPMRCDRIATAGYHCQHLGTKRCNGSKAPAYIYEHIEYEPILDLD